jgi:alkylation response protein AidB-like acyl-CoA dehydrogenase
MASFFHDNKDLQFYFDRGVDWDALVRLTEADLKAPGSHGSVKEAVDFYRDIASMVGEFAAEQIAPYALEIDDHGVLFKDGEAVFPPRLSGIFDQIKELELHGMCLPRDLGGLWAPLLVYWMSAEMIARGDVSVMAHHGFHGGIALAMLIFSLEEGSTQWDPAKLSLTKTRWEKEIKEIAKGEAWGCMDITEPDAGSDMGALKAVGEQDDKGNWFVTGQKIFITSGHGKYHFVIARTEKVQNPDDPMSGLKGLSMFLVKAYEDGPDGKRTRIVGLDRIEEKLGHHGSATAALNFDRAPAQLVGKRGEGFKYMLTLMNNARIAVGFECLGLCEAAYRAAKQYASERKSMGKTIDQHELIAEMLEEMEVTLLGLRALAIDSCYAEEMSRKHKILGNATDAKRWGTKARRLTPLLKYLAAESAVDFGRKCIQIHGGNGYIHEFPAEKLLRDALVMPIYEGTSQIQALMAMKDTLIGIIKNPQGFVKRQAEARWRTLSRDSLERRVAKLQVQSLNVQQYLVAKTAGDKFKTLRDKPVAEWGTEFTKNWDPKRDFAYAMLHAERLARLLIDEAIAEILLEQAKKFPERREVLERFLELAEIRSRQLAEQITTTGGRLLERLSRQRVAAQATAKAS